jgi:hypothetical protein
MADENGWCSVGVPIPIRVDCIWIGRNVEVAEVGQLVESVTVAIGWLCFALSFNGLVTQGYPRWRFALVRGKRPRELTSGSFDAVLGALFTQ